jgi:hypothetical protein
VSNSVKSENPVVVEFGQAFLLDLLDQHPDFDRCPGAETTYIEPQGAHEVGYVTGRASDQVVTQTVEETVGSDLVEEVADRDRFQALTVG